MKNILKHVTSLALSTAILASIPAHAADYTLRFAHHFPAVSAPHKEIFQKWADKVEKESGGRIEVEIYPASTLAKPPAQYDAVSRGIADITATIQGYTANRFPLTQIVELPGLAQNAAQGSCIIQGLYDEGLIDQEYKKTHPLFLFTHGAGHIHTTNKPIQVPSDLEGLRIRRPSAVVASMLEGLGAQPVGMPAPEAYQATQRGVIDGVSLPWEGQLVFRLNELTPYHTEVGGLYALSFVVTMNKATYMRMPKDLQAVLDNNSGKVWSDIAASVFDKLDAKGRQQAVDNGDKIIVIDGGVENPDWKPVLDKATEAYLASLEKKGLPAREVYARAKSLASTCQ